MEISITLKMHFTTLQSFSKTCCTSLRSKKAEVGKTLIENEFRVVSYHLHWKIKNLPNRTRMHCILYCIFVYVIAMFFARRLKLLRCKRRKKGQRHCSWARTHEDDDDDA